MAIQHLAKGFARLIRLEIEQNLGLGAALAPPLAGSSGRLFAHLLQAARRRLFTSHRLRQPGAAGDLLLGLLRQKRLKREAGALQPQLAKLQYLACLIEQAPVVAHQQIAAAVVGKLAPEPVDAGSIEVVVRLIEQQKVILPGKERQQAQAGKLAAAQGADLGMGIEPQSRLAEQVGKIASHTPTIAQQLEIAHGAAPLLDALKGPQ
ncbi:hypothetical protein D3C73_1087030 [compost metagenome]